MYPSSVGGSPWLLTVMQCAGLKQLVENFAPEERLDFHNNAQQEIKFPFQLGEETHHATKPDVIASLPGLPFDLKLPDRWRNISVVFEAKATKDGDPMVFWSKTHNETLVQLSKSARNILVAQSRLLAFSVGIYGPVARIFRFDHAGAVCSEPFKQILRQQRCHTVQVPLASRQSHPYRLQYRRLRSNRRPRDDARCPAPREISVAGRQGGREQ